ncbi:dihydrodipicolinate synthase family protein [Actinotignum urinale]|uniref:Dihydrodipicolinate synthase family protein n=1 Tax=Actinotignum urinale TaxID=190146 RepID=A0ABU5G5Z1_9ACTO|nr:dihydrodipicolinate synthase family protein [Actinotignum urinale]MDY5132474.1 dihydrodipicolinate synthase family protein [Actinotignum urinale]WIK58680.1 dihydrodipicolinate synthase family protein [Actinotignum urinale]
MFHGIYTPSVTPLRDDESIDFEGWATHIDRLIGAGINGILIFGSIGEFYSFTEEEKREAVDFAVKHVDGRVQLLVGVGNTSLKEACELTAYSAKAGADAVVAVSPYYFGPSSEVAYKYFAAIAGACDIDVLLYNFPDRTGSDLSPELVARLAREFPNIVGIKDTVDTASHTRRILRAVRPFRRDFAVLSGYDEYYLSNRASGGNGILTGMTNVEPETFVALHKAYEAGDFATVAAKARRVAILMELYEVTELFISAIKGGVKVKGVDISTRIKEPACQLTDEQVGRIKEILALPNETLSSKAE